MHDTAVNQNKELRDHPQKADSEYANDAVLADFSKKLQAFHANANANANADADALEQETREMHISHAEVMDCIECSSVYIFDFAHMQYCYTSKEFGKLIGCGSRKENSSADVNRENTAAAPHSPDPSGIQEMIPICDKNFFRRVHPDDMQAICSTILSSMEYLHTLPEDQREEYKLCYDFRILDAKGKYVRILQQFVPLEMDKEGELRLVLMVNDLSPLIDPMKPLRRYLENTQTGEMVLFPRTDARLRPPLTTSELEVLSLIAQGYSGSTIADILHIGVCTVNKRRQKKLLLMHTHDGLSTARYGAQYNLT
ncbi:MAG: LuxR C-terminal-related transcriptional regulator [Spirochaetia bacterium]|nr:LuxR C-terminal-related transcriptional regulator [Spirochaetia bacterium]